MDEKLKAEKQLKKALAALDTAVQKWYEANAPENTERYATCHIRDFPEWSDLRHVSNITLCIREDEYVHIESSKERG